MKTQFYLMRPFTNLHVGSGETNFGVIDNLIERDATSGFPCVNSSGLKGAIKQMLHDKGCNKLKEIFGSDSKKNNRDRGDKSASNHDNDSQQGGSSFLPAHLLALPVRSEKIPFVLATCPSIINHFISFWFDLTSEDHPQKEDLTLFAQTNPTSNVAYSLHPTLIDSNLGALNIGLKPCIAEVQVNGVKTAIKPENIKKAFGESAHIICIINDEKMLELCNDLNLPVIARNALEDGESQNLWYEQVLPRESLLFFPVVWGTGHKEIAEPHLLSSPLQIGGNASIGYGFTRLISIS